MYRPRAGAVLSSSRSGLTRDKRALACLREPETFWLKSRQVKGGRHEVPETAPQQAFEMLQVSARVRLFFEKPPVMAACISASCVGLPFLGKKLPFCRGGGSFPPFKPF